MSDEIVGVALQLGAQPTLKRVTHVEQAAAVSRDAPTLIVMGPTQRSNKFPPAAMLKKALVQLLEEAAGRSSGSGTANNLILRLRDSEGIAGAYMDHLARAKGRQPIKPQIMFVGAGVSAPYVAEPQSPFIIWLREALLLLDQVAPARVSTQRSPQDTDDENQLKLARARRVQLLAEEKWFNVPEVHKQQGGDPDAQGVNNTASRARRRGQLLGAWDGREYQHPQFQFDPQAGGRLMQEMKQLLEILPTDRSGWRQAFWLFQKHAQLDKRRPADVFRQDPGAVINAARSDFKLDDERW